MIDGIERPPNRLRELRDARNISLRDLAKATGVNFNVLGRVERGERPLDLPSMRAIAKALEIKPSELLNDQDVELRADELGREILATIDGLPREEHPFIVSALADIVRVSRRLAAQRSAAALAGDSNLVFGLADLWNSWTDDERQRMLQIMRLSSARQVMNGR